MSHSHLTAHALGILDTIDVPIVLLDGACRLAGFNEAASSALELAPPDIGQPLGEIHALKDVENLLASCAQVVDDGTPIQRHVLRGDRWYLVRIARHAELQSGVFGAVLTFTNVTAFRASVGQAIHDREYTKAILNRMNDALVVLDGELRIRTANRAFYEMFGNVREALLGTMLRDLGDDAWKRSDLWAALGRTLHEDAPFTPFQIERGFPAGRRTVLLEASRLLHGHSMDLLLTLRDVTERQRAQQVVRERVEQFETLVNRAPLGIYIVDAEFRIAQINPIAVPVFGDIPGGVIGRDFDEILHILWESEYADEMARIFRHTLATGESWATPERVERRRDRGVMESYEWRIDRIQFPEERHGVVCYFRDISAQVRTRDALKDADRRKDEFLATLAHELRNPLAPLRNSLQLLRMTAGVDAGAHRIHDMMERQVAHMVRLVDDLLELSRISRGKIQLNRQRLDLAAVIRQSVELSRHLVDAAHHTLAVSLPAERVFVDGDMVRLAQVFANLLNNAAKFTEPGGKITITASRSEGEAVVSVRDTGIGIARPMIGRVFEIFAQVENPLRRTQDGLGIGLSLVRTLVTMHGGSVEAASEGLGLGSEFIVRLPLHEQAGIGPEADDRNGDEPAALTCRVLIADDNRDSADSLASILRLLGADVLVAYDGPSALEKLRICSPEVVIADVGMPGMDGYELARRVREDAAHRDVILIAVTGWGQASDRHRAAEAGFDHHLVKPVEYGSLQAVLMSVTGKAKALPR